MVDFSARVRAVRGIIPLLGIVVIVATGSYTPQVSSAKSSNPTYSESRGVDAREFAFTARGATKPEGASDSLAQRVDSIFAGFASTNRPGCAVALYRDGRPIYERGFGVANVEDGIPITEHSAFQIGSESKQFTAFVIMSLVESGRISLNDEIHRYLPELPSYGTPIRIRHLLWHTSGLRDIYEILDLADQQDVYVDDSTFTRWVTAQHSLNFRPGTSFLYSNTNYVLLAKIASRVSGLSFPALLQKVVFSPLQLTETSLPTPITALVAHRAKAYTSDESGHLQNRRQEGEIFGSTGIYTTVDDLAKWDAVFTTPPPALAPIMRRLVEVGQLDSGVALDYAGGVRIESYRGLRLITHGGIDEGYTANVFHFPERHFGGAVLCNTNRAQPWSYTPLLADAALGETLGQSAPAVERPPTIAELSHYAGVYYNAQYGSTMELVLRDGVLGPKGSTSVSLRWLHGRRFQLTPFPVQIEFYPASPSGTFNMTKFIPDVAPVVSERATLVNPTRTELGAYEGTFENADLEQRLVIARDSTGLTMRDAHERHGPLVPTVHDAFEWDATGAFVRPERDPSGHILGLRVASENYRSLNWEFLKKTAAGGR